MPGGTRPTTDSPFQCTVAGFQPPWNATSGYNGRDMNRRSFFRSALAASAATAAVPPPAAAAIPKMKVTRVRVWSPPNPNPLFNQSDMVVPVETDAGITGIGEAGTPDLLVQCARRVIGQDPSRIEHPWQDMFRAFFYPPGRERMDALGAIDLAHWD